MAISPNDQTYYNSLIQQLMGIQDPNSAPIAQGWINRLQSSLSTNTPFPTAQHGFGEVDQILGFLAQNGNKNVSTTTTMDGQPYHEYIGGPTLSTGNGGASTTLPGNTSVANALSGSTGVEDQAKIEAEGKRQYDQTIQSINDLGKSQQDYATQTFSRMLPGLAEDYNAGHLLNSTGYQQEAARQASYLSQDVAANKAGSIAKALTGLQGFQTSGLNRDFSVQDFMKQAQLSRELGAMSAPQMGSGKGAVGSTLSGVGSLAPYAMLATGNPGGAAAMSAASLPSRGGSGGGGKG